MSALEHSKFQRGSTVPAEFFDDPDEESQSEQPLLRASALKARIPSRNLLFNPIRKKKAIASVIHSSEELPDAAEEDAREESAVELVIQEQPSKKRGRDPEFLKYLSSKRNVSIQSRIEQMLDHTEHNIRHNVKSHLEKVKENILRRSAKQAELDLHIDHPERQQSIIESSPLKIRPMLSVNQVEGIFVNTERTVDPLQERTKATQTSTGESSDPTNPSARRWAVLQTEGSDQLLISEPLQSRTANSKVPIYANGISSVGSDHQAVGQQNQIKQKGAGVVDAQKQGESPPESETDRFVLRGRKLPLKEYANSELSLRELEELGAQRAHEDDLYGQTELLDFNRFGLPEVEDELEQLEFNSKSKADTKDSAFKDHGSQFPEIQEPIKMTQEEILNSEERCVALINKGKLGEALEVISELTASGELQENDPHAMYYNYSELLRTILLVDNLKYLTAEIYAQQKNSQQAIKCAQDALQTIADVQSKDKNLFLYEYGLLNLLGNLQLQQKQPKQAYETYQRVDDLLNEGEVGDEMIQAEVFKLSEELHHVTYNKANALTALGHHAEAAPLYKSVLEKLSEADGLGNKKRYISCLKKQAEALLYTNQLQQAQSHLKTGLKELLSTKELQNELPLVASYYDLLSATALRRQVPQEALKYANTSLKIKLAHFGSDSAQTALSLIAAGKAYLAMKMYQEAYTKFQAATEILEKSQGRYTIVCANCYVLMAQIMYRLTKYQLAVDLYELALDNFITIMGKDHLYTNRIYLNLLHLSFLLQSKNKLAYFEQKMLGALEGVISNGTAVIFNEVGNIYRTNRQYKKAIAFYSRSTQLVETLLEEERSEEEATKLAKQQATIFCNIGSTYHSRGELEESVQKFNTALHILEQNGGSDSAQQKAQVNTLLAKVLIALKRNDKASESIKKAQGLLHGTKDSKAALKELADLEKSLSASAQ